MNATSDLKGTLEKSMRWENKGQIMTPKGPRILLTSAPSVEFWGIWKREKEACKALEIAPRPIGQNDWIVNWYLPLPTPAPVREFKMPEAPAGRTWSAEQNLIFTWFATSRLPNGTSARCLVVRARAGTGKTTTIKIAFSVATEERCLYAVFGKKNQREAAECIFDPRVEIKTLHSLGNMFINAVWPNSRPDKQVEFERVVAVVGAQAPNEVRVQVRKLVEFAKNVFVGVPTIDDMTGLAEERDIETPNYEKEEDGGYTRRVLASYACKVLEASKVRDPQGRISFNDMVWLPVTMGWVRGWFDLVVVDECQDMNLPQLMMAIAACKKGGRICVVGDDRQAIYHFRGAASDGMNMMQMKLQAAELGLTLTFRCAKKIVELAQKLVPDYRAADSNPEGIVDGCDAVNIVKTVAVGDAVLSRSNAPLMPLCLRLLAKGVSARVEGRDIGRTLRDIVEKLNARSVPDFMSKVYHWKERQLSRFEDSPNFEEKAAQIEDQSATLEAIAEGATSVGEIDRRLDTLFEDSDKATKPAVVLSTVHKAKGLEWDHVYMLRDTFNKKRPPTAPPLSPAAEAARAKEEANVYYVALTRAKNHLTMAAGDTRA